jgi:hypothetical protein
VLNWFIKKCLSTQLLTQSLTHIILLGHNNSLIVIITQLFLCKYLTSYENHHNMPINIYISVHYNNEIHLHAECKNNTKSFKENNI